MLYLWILKATFWSTQSERILRAPPPKFDAFDPEGKFLGTLSTTGLKAFPRGALVGRDCVWIIERDEEDQVQVVKYRIAPGK
jgi:hypothetical protein